MRARIGFIVALGSLLGVSACKPEGTAAAPGKAAAQDVPKRKPGMPRPYNLPGKPELALHVAVPSETLDAIAAFVPGVPDARTLVRDTFGAHGPLERQVAELVDLKRPWDAAWVENQLVVQLPIERAHAQRVQQLLANKAPVGRFGAVDLARGTAPGPKLAWFDEATSTLAFADDERGLVTAQEIPRAYGKDPITLIAEGQRVRTWVPEADFTSITVRGRGTDALDVVVDGAPVERMPWLADVANGALTSLLDAPKLAAGVSTRYAHHSRDVKKLMSRGQRAVDDLPFLVRGNGEDLLRRVGSVARSWNGRVLGGIGPERHVLVALGTDDAKKTAGAMYHLMSGVTDNLDMAEMFVSGIPSIRWKKNFANAGGNTISVFVLEKARKFVPEEVHALLDDRGELRVAMAFPPSAKAAMVAIGPKAEHVLTDWIGEAGKSGGGQDLVSASVALAPAMLRDLLQGRIDPLKLLEIKAQAEPTTLVVRREAERIELSVRGPKLDPPPPVAAARPASHDARRDPTRVPGRARPAPAKPVRSKPVAGR
jgi:hypothetical protein